MARRTKQELLAEFHRLFDIFELFVEFQIAWETERDGASLWPRVPSREDDLADVENGGATLSQSVSGLRDAVNDQNEMLGYAAEEGDPFVPKFLAFYRARTGRDYYDDAGSPRKMGRLILKRGHIADATEYRLINGILSDTTQTVFKEKEIGRVNEMLDRFGETVRNE